jgi:carboxypeptidase C (cathepsin A)
VNLRLLIAAACMLASCGGGGGGGSSSTVATPPTPSSSFTDPVTYSSAPGASLAGAAEITATSKRQVTVNGTALAYTATAGHMSAVSLVNAQPEASFFYVAYTLDAADPATRPVTFFYNGGPGSASVWLHLGSYGPRRIATDTPGAAGPTPYPLVDNAETLLDTTDLVFVDAVGSGLSEAIAPNTNKTFWGVDADAAVFRDFIIRYLAVNNRNASPRFLFGESYGTTRSAVLANLLESAGVSLKGVVLLSSALDYNANCGIVDDKLSCAANLPSYHAAAAWYHVANPDPGSAGLAASLDTARTVGDNEWDPAIRTFLASHAVQASADPQLVAKLTGLTGIAAAQWPAHFNLHFGEFQTLLVPGRVTGLYDARVSAPFAPLLANQGDPSSSYINSSFAARIVEHLRDLGYTTPSQYVMLSNAIDGWNFSHDGRALPDTVPDLAAAFAHNPRLKVFSTGGYHDLVTPFHVTERDASRLGGGASLVHHFYVGGHMTYLDDGARRQQKADLVQFMRSAL